MESLENQFNVEEESYGNKALLEYKHKTEARRGLINPEISVLRAEESRAGSEDERKLARMRERMNEIMRQKRSFLKKTDNINHFLERLGWPRHLPKGIDLSTVEHYDRQSLLQPFRGLILSPEQYEDVKYDLDIIADWISQATGIVDLPPLCAIEGAFD